MDNYFAELDRLRKSLDGLRGEAVLRRMREIIDLAKRNEDGDTVADFAQALVEIGNAEGRLDYEMIGFGELRDLYLRDDRFADLKRQVLWYYKWLGERLPEYVEVPATQIWGMLDQMEALYRQESVGLRPVHGLRCRAASLMGLKDEAERHYDLWEASERGDSDDCPACETHLKVQVLLDQARIDEAIDAAGPILAGDEHCGEVPAVTFSRLLMPLLVKQDQRAPSMCAAVLRQVRSSPKFVGYLADHVTFLTLIGAGVGVRLCWVMLAMGEEASNGQDRFLVARAAWTHFAVLRKAGVTEVKLPTRIGEDARRVGRGRFVSEGVGIDEAVERYGRRATDLAAAFDQRNGTDRFSKRIEFARELGKRE